MKLKFIIFPILFLCGILAINIYKGSIVCKGVEKLYLMEFKGRLTDRYLINNTYTHLKFYTGKDTIEPSYASYGGALLGYIDIGDSLYKTSYDDSCTLFKKEKYVGFDTCSNIRGYHWSRKVIFDEDCDECPIDKRKKIRHELDSLRSSK